MTCPACSATLDAGQDRCSVCGAIVSPPVEGALAPDPASLPPPSSPSGTARRKGEGRREIPALRRKEPTWKDEVRERVQLRRRQRTGEEDDELPLFREAEGRAPEARHPRAEGPMADDGDADADPYAVTERVSRSALDEEDPAGELPLRPAVAGEDRDEADTGDEAFAAPAPGRLPPPASSEAAEPFDEEESAADWTLGLKPPTREPRPVERPARPGERVQAALVDLALLASLCAVVIYFASRAAHVPVPGLLRSSLYLGGYLAFLGFAYAIYFTGTTGQTVGKMTAGLRVVDSAGRPPGHVRALLRAVVAVLGIVAVGGGLVPIFFDPARRALHDRLLKTRVIKG